MSWKITFTASENIGSRTLVLLLAFDFAASNLPANQEEHPVVWKILKFQKTSTLVHDVTYTDRLAFTQAVKSKPPPQNEERWILSLDPKVVQEVNAKQETMIVQNPNDPTDFSFAKPINLTYPRSVAMNGTQVLVDLAFGFYETDKPKPAQILCFHQIPQYTPVSLQFVPVLKAYFVPEDFYVEGEVLTMPIPTDSALNVDIHLLKKDQKCFVFIDETNKAGIRYE